MYRFNDVLKTVTSLTGITLEIMRSRTRVRGIVDVRQVVVRYRALRLGRDGPAIQRDGGFEVARCKCAVSEPVIGPAEPICEIFVGRDVGENVNDRVFDFSTIHFVYASSAQILLMITTELIPSIPKELFNM